MMISFPPLEGFSRYWKKNLPVQVVIMTVGDYSETSFALYRNEITLDPIEALRLGETRHKEA